MEDQIKDILRPHFGHLNFLMKIKRDEISINDIGYLVELLENKSIVSNLPKELHSYNSYYTLLKDYYFVKRNYSLIRFIKDNLSSTSKDIFLRIIEKESNQKLLFAIINNEELSKLFLRWSSRIQTEDSAENYLQSVVLNTGVINALDDGKSVLVELVDFSKQAKLIPTSWCIKDASTFSRYKRNHRMFILKYEGLLFGINYSGSRIISIFNNNNKSLDENDPIFDIAKSEMAKLNLFGMSLEDKAEKAMDEIIGPVRLINTNKQTFMQKLRRIFL